MKKQKSPYKDTYVFYANSIPFNGDTIDEKPLGGSESAVVYLARELHRLGKRVVVFSQTTEEKFCDGVEYRNLASFFPFIQKNIFDVFLSVRDVEIFKLPILARKKILWIHDAHDQPHLQPLKEREVLDQIDHIFAISHWQKEKYRETFGISEEKFFLTRNGVCQKHFKKYFRKRKKTLVYTSTPFRGLEVLLDCFPAIKEAEPEVELQVFSSMKVYGMDESDDQENFGHIYRKCQQPGVELMGSVKQEDLAKYLSRAYLFVYPNLFAETSCIAALEAQAAGLPCVVSSKGALPETVLHDETGMTIEGETQSHVFKDRFTHAILDYLKNKEKWERHSQKAHDLVLEKNSWSVIAQEWVAFFDQTVPKLSLCMIVKDEEKNISDCLKSVAPIVDEMVIVDTGSHDKTVEIAKSFDAKVYHYQWRNDFSKARNFSLSKATGDWVLVLDADEVIAFQDLEKIKSFLNVTKAVAFRFFQRSYLDDKQVAGWKPNDRQYEEGKDYEGYYDSYLVRLFRNHRGFKFEGRVHETIENSILNQKLVITNTDLPIHHYGKLSSEEKLAAKGKMYLEIGEKKHQEQLKDPKAVKELAVQAMELNQLEDAVRYFQKSIELDPFDFVAMVDLAVLYFKLAYPTHAIDLLQKAIELNEQYIPAYLNLGIVLRELERSEEAIGYFSQAAEKAPVNPSCWKELGATFVKLERFDEACRAFKKLKEMKSTDYFVEEAAIAYYEMGKRFFEMQDWSMAKKYFEEVLFIQPSSPKAISFLGVVFVRQNHFDKAIEKFEEVISICKVDPEAKDVLVDAFINLAYIENYHCRYEKSLRYLHEVLELDPFKPEVYNHLGIAKCGLGKLEEAKFMFEKALSLNPNLQGAKTNLMRIQEVLIKEKNQVSQVKD